jgi:hypothetical protein
VANRVRRFPAVDRTGERAPIGMARHVSAFGEHASGMEEGGPVARVEHASPYELAEHERRLVERGIARAVRRGKLVELCGHGHVHVARLSRLGAYGSGVVHR